MIYAPVIIPTLNRYDHLKKCVESLNKNHNAENTEVYISVDYPPSDKYQEGHDKICEYLEHSVFNFKKLHVIKQSENLGVFNNGKLKYGNSSFLVDLVQKNHDRWIFSEDDNVFAPCFLDFMNASLEQFKNDNTVFSICGYRFYYNLKFEENSFFRQHSDFNGWGCGYWKEKYSEMRKLEVGYLKGLLYNPIRVMRIWKVSNKQILHLTGLSQQAFFKKGDNFTTLYMIDHGMTQIMPKKSFVRNIGWDESGMHCLGFDNDINKQFLSQDIDDSTTFEGIIGSGWELFKENERVIRREDFQREHFLKVAIKLILRIICFWK